MQLGRGERRDRWPAANANAGNVPTEHSIIPMINVMVTGVTRRGDGADFERRQADSFHVLQDPHSRGRYRSNSAPKSLHLIAKDALCGLDQFRWIDKVRRAARMHINSRARPSRTGGFSKTPRGPSMIKMDVAEKNMANVLGREAMFAQIDNHIIEGRFRSRIEKCDTVVRLKRSRCNDAGESELSSVEDVNVQADYFFETATM